VHNNNINILAIESSCDETSAAIVRNGKVLSNIIATQKVHERYGGVVPEMASRAHMQNIVPVVDAALADADTKKQDISAVAFTQAPGLLGSLLVGTCFAKSFAQALQLPLIAVHHMQAHVLAHFIDQAPPFPFMCLTVSGGHTQIVLCRSHLDMEILGETIDDAAGEAFDKVAKMLGLPYPGGPLVDKYAAQGDASRFKFPMSEMKGYNFSFSGIKTAVLYFLQAQNKINANFAEQNIQDICASVQATIINMLMAKLKKAAADNNVTHIGIAGGVSANSGLRKAIVSTGQKLGWTTYIPAFEYCTDNAAMVAMAAHFMYQENVFLSLETSPEPSMKFVSNT
jgi:N6-L-threonylcarbamoyladenine synthase